MAIKRHEIHTVAFTKPRSVVHACFTQVQERPLVVIVLIAAPQYNIPTLTALRRNTASVAAIAGSYKRDLHQPEISKIWKGLLVLYKPRDITNSLKVGHYGLVILFLITHGVVKWRQSPGADVITTAFTEVKSVC